MSSTITLGPVSGRLPCIRRVSQKIEFILLNVQFHYLGDTLLYPNLDHCHCRGTDHCLNVLASENPTAVVYPRLPAHTLPYPCTPGNGEVFHCYLTGLIMHPGTTLALKPKPMSWQTLSGKMTISQDSHVEHIFTFAPFLLLLFTRTSPFQGNDCCGGNIATSQCFHPQHLKTCEDKSSLFPCIFVLVELLTVQLKMLHVFPISSFLVLLFAFMGFISVFNCSAFLGFIHFPGSR